MNDQDLICISPMLRAAIELHFPEYFAMSPEDRETWRALRQNGSRETHRAIYQHLLRNNFGCSEADLENANKGLLRLKPAVETAINREMICIDGIGDDLFMLNECLSEEKTILDFKTVRDYDRYNYAIQQSYLEEADRQPYRGYLYASWARILQNGELRYLNMSTLSSYVGMTLESFELDLSQELIPHQYDEGPENGQRTKDGYIRWDMVLNAHGKEDAYRALCDVTRSYIAGRCEAVQMKRDQTRTAEIWIFDDYSVIGSDFPESDSLTVVFSDQDALQNARFRHFMADCAAHAGKIGDLAQFLESEKEELRKFMVAIFEFLEKHPAIATKIAEKEITSADLQALIER